MSIKIPDQIETILINIHGIDFISSEAARELKPLTAPASDPGNSLQSQAKPLFLVFSPLIMINTRSGLWIFSRVFRKRVKAKDFNGHPPEPSGQSYY